MFIKLELYLYCLIKVDLCLYVRLYVYVRRNLVRVESRASKIKHDRGRQAVKKGESVTTLPKD